MGLRRSWPHAIPRAFKSSPSFFADCSRVFGLLHWLSLSMFKTAWHKDIYNDACPNLVVALSDFKQGPLARGSHRARAAVCPGGFAIRCSS